MASAILVDLRERFFGEVHSVEAALEMLKAALRLEDCEEAELQAFFTEVVEREQNAEVKEYAQGILDNL